MRKILCVSFILLVLGCKQKGKARLTVIYFDNQNFERKVNVDTLLNAHQIDLSKDTIDLFFCKKNFHIPYYVPTGGIYRDSGKDKECDWTIYPHTVKCYQYDRQNRVVNMSVSGSGTESDFDYKYNGRDQVTQIIQNGSDSFELSYNIDGTLSELKKTESMEFEKKLVFIYN